MNTYKNPIIFADYSDPDVTRAGDGYYLTASSFNYTPGLPVLFSRDLINWKIVSYAVSSLGDEFKTPRHSEGIWAPSIRYHDDMFYIYYGMPDEGLFVVRGRFEKNISDDDSKKGLIHNFGIDLKVPGAEKIYWDKPVCVLKGKGYIDPCPFFDDDGRVYLIHGYAKSRIGFNSVLGVIELDSKGLTAASEDRFLFKGFCVNETMKEIEDAVFKNMVTATPDEKKAPCVTIEGPKVYKRGTFYYILSPAGGVRRGWQLALRSENIQGPYECRVVMHQGSSIINGPHQGALISDDENADFFLHFQDLGAYGRICHLQPVTWQDGWPVIGENKDGIGEPVEESASPITAYDGDENATAYDTSGDIQWLGNYDTEYFEVIDDKNVISKDMADLLHEKSSYLGNSGTRKLKLQALNNQGKSPVIWKSPNVITRKLDRRSFTVDVTLDISQMQTGDRSGAVFIGGEYFYLECRKTDINEWEVFSGKSFSEDGAVQETSVRMKGALHSDNEARLKIRIVTKDKGGDSEFVNVDECRPESTFSYAIYDNEEPDMEVIEESFDPVDHTWVGAKIGMYAISEYSRGGYVVVDDYQWK